MGFRLCMCGQRLRKALAVEHVMLMRMMGVDEGQ